MKALILTDGKPGHENQSVAFCRHLGIEFEMATVSYPRKPAKAFSYLLDRLGIYSEKLFPCHLPPAPCHLVVSTGSTTFYPNKVVARKLGIPNVAILNPKGYRLDFSVIFCPAYDHPPKQENIIELPLNLCAADASFFTEKAAEFSRKHAQQKPAAGFIIGGPNAISEIDPVELKIKLDQAFKLTNGCERWVTTSRRTPKEVETLIESMPFDYRLIHSQDPYNPVPAFIELCDRLFVTSDSASMISEAASFGSSKVEILMNQQLKTPNKFEELIQGLEKRDAVHLFDGTLGTADRKIDIQPMLRNAWEEIIKARALTGHTHYKQGRLHM